MHTHEKCMQPLLCQFAAKATSKNENQPREESPQRSVTTVVSGLRCKGTKFKLLCQYFKQYILLYI